MLEYINDPNDIKQIQPDYSGSLQNDANLAIERYTSFSIKKCQSHRGASGIESWNCRTNDGAASCFGFSKRPADL